MPFQYKTVLLVGATSGIGAALADKFVAEGSKVIAVGRRQDKLDEFTRRHGIDRAAAIRFDITDWANMDGFVQSVTTRYSDVDCLFINSGIQRPTDLSKPSDVNLTEMHQELNTNFTSVVNLTMKFLPYLMAREGGASVIYTGSNLAWVPATTLPMYSSSKAALSAFILCLRDQLRTSSVKVIEVSPPLVQTELHDYMGSEKGRSLGIPVQEFTEAAYAGLADGKDQIVVGAVGPPPFNEAMLQTFNEIVDKRRSVCAYLAKMLRGEKESL